jgi:2-(1,2-epoxy-1,2-dihydrophenyl)acetyl-CoA isomerase
MSETVDHGPVLLEVADAVATVTLQRPDRLNAMTPELLVGLIGALQALAARDDVRVVVLTGAGRGFCAGGDLAEGLGVMLGDPPFEDQAARLRSSTDVSALLHRMPQVTIAAVNGACAGAGLSIALACDLRIATRRAKFTTAFLTAAVSGDFGGAWFVTRLLGAARARELFLMPDVLTADEALAAGLVTRVLDDDAFASGWREAAAELAARAPLALARLKANLLDAQDLDLDDYLDVETERQARSVLTADAGEAAQAFFEKRPASFTGT